MLAIAVKNLKKSFYSGKRRKYSVNGINLSIKSGRIYGFLGPNGAGKTTTIFMLSTLLLPTSGKAEILGFDMVEESAEIRKRIGLCTGGAKFYINMKPAEILNYYGMMQGMGSIRRHDRIEELIKKLKMEPFRNKLFSDLSTGMKQKVALAKALIAEPDVLFLDEPTNGLDVEAAFDIRNYIRDYVRETGMTTLLTSHHLYEVEDLCRKIAIIDRGRIVAEGGIESVKSRFNLPDIAKLMLDSYNGLESIKDLPFVYSYEVNENGLFVKLQKGSDSIISLMHILKTGYKKKILDLEIRKASLEEVFMKIVRENDA